MPQATNLSNLLQTWKDCKKCTLHHRRRKIVHLRGHTPAPVLFIGEAPGRTEDLTGKPFTGEAGQKVLDPLITDIQRRLQQTFRYAITNVVACLPEEDKGYLAQDPDIGDYWQENWQLRPPTKAESEACRPRLLETLQLCSPLFIIVMGSTAARDFSPIIKSQIFPAQRVLGVWHPSYILRQSQDLGIIPSSSLEFKKTAISVFEFLEPHKQELIDYACKPPKKEINKVFQQTRSGQQPKVQVKLPRRR